ncbi:MAG TPA: ribosome maturation factor RimP [bacterium]|nr:ribosome maturation factor RimP [bacterium]
MGTLEDAIEKLAEPVLARMGLELVDLELGRTGGRLLVRLFIDRANREAGGVSVRECGDFNLALGRLLDVEGVLQESHVLEVSSPGLDRRIRKLRDFRRHQGETVTVHLKAPRDGRKKVKGRIALADEDGITIEAQGLSFRLRHDEISRANLEYRFEDE